MRLGFEKARWRDLTEHRPDPIGDYRPLPDRIANRYAFSKPRKKQTIFPDKTAILYVTTRSGTYRALWRRVHNCWGCYQADEPLKWMLDLDDKQVSIHLRYHVRYDAWTYQWISTLHKAVAPRQMDGHGAVGRSVQLIPENGGRELRHQNDRTKRGNPLTNSHRSAHSEPRKDTAPIVAATVCAAQSTARLASRQNMPVSASARSNATFGISELLPATDSLSLEAGSTAGATPVSLE